MAKLRADMQKKKYIYKNKNIESVTQMIFLALFLPSSCALLVGKVNSPYPRYMHGLQRRQTPAAASSSWQNVECERSWSNRLGVTLTPITTGVWAAERPFYWNGIDVGGRMVVCRMRDGSLLVHSPVNLTDDLRTALEVERHLLLSPHI